MPVSPQELWHEKDGKGQENDWDVHGMNGVRTVLVSTAPHMGWRRYDGSDVASERWAVAL
ncbi:hypothetical protein [Streptomyces nigrescens]